MWVPADRSFWADVPFALKVFLPASFVFRLTNQRNCFLGFCGELHYEKHRAASDTHCIALDTESLAIECRECGCEIFDGRKNARRRKFRAAFLGFFPPSPGKEVNETVLRALQLPARAFEPAVMLLFASTLFRKIMKRLFVNENYVRKSLGRRVLPHAVKVLAKMLYFLKRGIGGDGAAEKFCAAVAAEAPEACKYIGARPRPAFDAAIKLVERKIKGILRGGGVEGSPVSLAFEGWMEAKIVCESCGEAKNHRFVLGPLASHPSTPPVEAATPTDVTATVVEWLRRACETDKLICSACKVTRTIEVGTTRLPATLVLWAEETGDRRTTLGLPPVLEEHIDLTSLEKGKSKFISRVSKLSDFDQFPRAELPYSPAHFSLSAVIREDPKSGEYTTFLRLGGGVGWVSIHRGSSTTLGNFSSIISSPGRIVALSYSRALRSDSLASSLFSLTKSKSSIDLGVPSLCLPGHFVSSLLYGSPQATLNLSNLSMICPHNRLRPSIRDVYSHPSFSLSHGPLPALSTRKFTAALASCGPETTHATLEFLLQAEELPASVVESLENRLSQTPLLSRIQPEVPCFACGEEARNLVAKKTVEKSIVFELLARGESEGPKLPSPWLENFVRYLLADSRLFSDSRAEIFDRPFVPPTKSDAHGSGESRAVPPSFASFLTEFFSFPGERNEFHPTPASISSLKRWLLNWPGSLPPEAFDRVLKINSRLNCAFMLRLGSTFKALNFSEAVKSERFNAKVSKDLLNLFGTYDFNSVKFEPSREILDVLDPIGSGKQTCLDYRPPVVPEVSENQQPNLHKSENPKAFSKIPLLPKKSETKPQTPLIPSISPILPHAHVYDDKPVAPPIPAISTFETPPAIPRVSESALHPLPPAESAIDQIPLICPPELEISPRIADSKGVDSFWVDDRSEESGWTNKASIDVYLKNPELKNPKTAAQLARELMSDQASLSDSQLEHRIEEAKLRTQLESSPQEPLNSDPDVDVQEVEKSNEDEDSDDVDASMRRTLESGGKKSKFWTMSLGKHFGSGADDSDLSDRDGLDPSNPGETTPPRLSDKKKRSLPSSIVKSSSQTFEPKTPDDSHGGGPASVDNSARKKLRTSSSKDNYPCAFTFDNLSTPQPLTHDSSTPQSLNGSTPQPQTPETGFFLVIKKSPIVNPIKTINLASDSESYNKAEDPLCGSRTN